MKIIINIMVVLVVLIIKTNAQAYHPFPTGAASWKIVRCSYFYQPGWHDEYTLTMDGTDTILNAVSFKKITISNHHLPGTVNDTIYPTEFFGGLRENNKQIFMWKSWGVTDTTAKLVYDFNRTNVGDTIFTNVLTGNLNLFGHLITSKDSVLIGTQYNMRLHLQDVNNSNNIEDWIEGVGSSWGLPFATYWSATDNSYDLTCFYQDKNLVYGNPLPIYSYCQAPLPVIVCDSMISSVAEPVSKNEFFNLYPNPASEITVLNFNTSINEGVSLNIYNSLGVLLRTEVLRKDYQLNIGDLKNGIYFIEIKSENWSEKQKLIIQR